MMLSTTAVGLEAPVIDRPITRYVEPPAIASHGVTTRR